MELATHINEALLLGDKSRQGLGLAIVQKIAKLHEWQLEVQSEVGVGTEVVISQIACMP